MVLVLPGVRSEIVLSPSDAAAVRRSLQGRGRLILSGRDLHSTSRTNFALLVISLQHRHQSTHLLMIYSLRGSTVVLCAEYHRCLHICFSVCCLLACEVVINLVCTRFCIRPYMGVCSYSVVLRELFLHVGVVTHAHAWHAVYGGVSELWTRDILHVPL